MALNIQNLHTTSDVAVHICNSSIDTVETDDIFTARWPANLAKLLKFGFSEKSLS